MFTKTFFKLFPPPKFLNIHYAGLDISDDAVHCIDFSKGISSYKLHRYGSIPLKAGVVEGGHIKNEAELGAAIHSLTKSLKIHTVKASLPEERMYLFKTEIANAREDEIRQKIDFKLEENVPLAAKDAIFFYDRIPDINKNGKIQASVSVAPKELVDSYLKVISAAGVQVISFEIQAKAIAHAVVPRDSIETQIIVNSMNRKVGIYIVCGGVVCFTSTLAIEKGADISILQRELNKVYTYWLDYGDGAPINRIILAGCDAVRVGGFSNLSPDPKIPVELAQIWRNAFSNAHHIPKLKHDDSLEYAVAAGLALP